MDVSRKAQDSAPSAATYTGDSARQNSKSHNTSLILEVTAGANGSPTIDKEARPCDAVEIEPGHCNQHCGLDQPAEGPALLNEPVSLQDRSAGGVYIAPAASRMPHQGMHMENSEAGADASSSMLPHQEKTGLSGIQLATASGKPIQQASKNLSRAANLFADLFEEEGTAVEPARNGSNQLHLGATASPAFELTTASGKRLEVGTAALDRGRRFMSEVVTDASVRDDTLSKGMLKRTASDMLTTLDPATPGPAYRRAGQLDNQTAIGSAEMPSALREDQPALGRQRQGNYGNHIIIVLDACILSCQANFVTTSYPWKDLKCMQSIIEMFTFKHLRE